MSDKNTITATNVQEDVVNVIEALQKWHADILATLKAVVEMDPKNDLVIDAKGLGPLTLSGSDKAFVQMGIHIAIEAFEKFPITISKPGPIFLEGAEAWADCLELTDCPYPEGSPEAEQWKAGWTAEEEG